MLTAYQDKIALGSKVDIIVVCDATPEVAEEIFRKFWIAIFTFEKKFSRFLPQSELSQFNRAAGIRQPISQEFNALLRAAAAIARKSQELYNPFILPTLQRSGYVKSLVPAHAHDKVDDYSNRIVVPIEQLEIGSGWARIPAEGALDMGGCGKGFLCDRLAELAESIDVLHGYSISLGGDVIVGGHTAENKRWDIGIDRTADDGRSLAGHVISSVDTRYAVATSSVLYRKGIKDGRPWHHIIDPHTNQPAVASYATATVSAFSGLIADVAASCVLMLDEAEAIQFAQRIGALGLLLQRHDGSLVRWGDIIVAMQE